MKNYKALPTPNVLDYEISNDYPSKESKVDVKHLGILLLALDIDP